jgi:hypothetical protein
VPRFRLDPLSPTGVSLAQGVSNVWEVTGGGGTGGTSDVEALDDLSDVIITGAGSGQVLTYNGSEWVNDSVGGTGDVVGPASSTDLAIARFDGATGKLLQNSTATLGDSGGIATTIADTGNAAGLTLIQNDVTNNPLGISVVNAATNNGIQINQTGNLAASKAGLLINQSGTIGSGGSALYINNDSAGRSLYVRQDGAVGASDRGVYVLSDTTSQTAANGRLVEFKEDTASSTIDLLYLQQDGTGRGLFVDHNNAGVTLHIDKDVTNANLASAVTLQVDHTAVVNDGATYTKTTPAVQIASNVTETSGTITDSAQVLDINQTHADASGDVVNIDNDGAGTAFFVQQDGTLTTSKRAVDIRLNSDLSVTGSGGQYIYSNTAHTVSTFGSAWLLRVENDHASSVNSMIHLKQDGTGNLMDIDNNNTGKSINIDHDGSSASAITGINIDVANAGAGAGQAINIAAGKLTGTWDFSVDPTVPDEAYGVGWNASLEVPTKNALYDKIEAMGGGVSESFVIAMAIALG